MSEKWAKMALHEILGPNIDKPNWLIPFLLGFLRAMGIGPKINSTST